MKGTGYKIVLLSNKGQVVIPADVRKKLGWQQEEYLILNANDSGVLLSRLTPEQLRAQEK